MNAGRPISEDDLHGYVDGALDPARHAEIEGYLRDQPDVAQRVDVYRSQRQALRDALGPVAREPVPPELSMARLIEGHRRRHAVPPWASAAAAVLLFAIGGGSGWLLRGFDVPSNRGLAVLAQEAADTYGVFGTDQNHPVEIKAADQASLLKWVSNRINRPIRVPDLTAAGYTFMGGRVVATGHGAAGLFMYDDPHGQRVAVLVRPMASDVTAPMSEHVLGQTQGFAWATKGVGYSFVGPADATGLHPIANEVRRQLERGV